MSRKWSEPDEIGKHHELKGSIDVLKFVGCKLKVIEILGSGLTGSSFEFFSRFGGLTVIDIGDTQIDCVRGRLGCSRPCHSWLGQIRSREYECQRRHCGAG